MLSSCYGNFFHDFYDHKILLCGLGQYDIYYYTTERIYIQNTHFSIESIKTIEMQSSQSIFLHHFSKAAPKHPKAKPTCILVGKTGAGKTCLYNKLCGTDFDSGAGKGSVTRKLCRHDVIHGVNPFLLIDTPGVDSKEETVKHAILLKEGLTATEISTIFIVLKFDNRFERLFDQYVEVMSPFLN